MNVLSRKILLIASASLVSLVGIGLGQSVTIQVRTGGFEDAASGTGVNGMAWGLVVDTGSTGFDSLTSNLESFSFPGFDSRVDLSLAGVTNSSLLFERASENTVNGPPPSLSPGYMNEIQVGLNGGVSSGQNYGIMWFPSGSADFGDSFGFVNPGLTLPADGATLDISSSVSSGSADFNVIPEPSAYAMIFGIFGLGYAVFSRRRRSSSQE